MRDNPAEVMIIVNITHNSDFESVRSWRQLAYQFFFCENPERI